MFTFKNKIQPKLRQINYNELKLFGFPDFSRKMRKMSKRKKT